MCHEKKNIYISPKTDSQMVDFRTEAEADNRNQISSLLRAYAFYIFPIYWGMAAVLVASKALDRGGIWAAFFTALIWILIAARFAAKLVDWSRGWLKLDYGLSLDFPLEKRIVGGLIFVAINAVLLCFTIFIPFSLAQAFIQIFVGTIIFKKIILHFYDKKIAKDVFNRPNMERDFEQPVEKPVENRKSLTAPTAIVDITPANDNRDTVLHTEDNADDYNIPTGYGSSYWMSDTLKNLRTDIEFTEQGKQFSGMGLWVGGGFFNHKEGNLCTIAPPGKGKGAALIIPNLLWNRTYPHSFFVFDPKGTNVCITARYQKERGQKVIVIDPINLQGMNGFETPFPTACFNPLDEIIDDVYNGCALIANLLLPNDPKASDPFWNNKARDFIQGVLMHVMTDDEYETKRNLVTFYRLIKQGDFDKLFVDMIGNINVNYEVSHTGSEFFKMMKSTDKTFLSVLSSVTNAINWLGNPSIQKIITKSDFKAEDIAGGGVTMYLCQPIHQKEQFATFSRLIVGSLLRKNAQPSAKPKAWVYYLLDEFPSMGLFPEVVDSLALAREYKMRIWLFAQSISQFDELYKQEGRNRILGNTGIIQSIQVTDSVSQEYISNRVGSATRYENVTSSTWKETTTITNSYASDPIYGRSSKNDGKTWDKTNSTNTSGHSRKLLMPEEAEREPYIVTLTEYGAMRLVKWQYWEGDDIDPIGKVYTEIMLPRADRNPNFH